MGVLISLLRNFMTRFPPLLIQMGVLISLLRNSMTRVLLDVDYASSIHTIYAYLTGLLLALVDLKYQALMNTSPFNDHPALMILFLIAITLYAMALFVLRSNHQINAMIWVCHICGSLACELLLLLLVSPLWSFIINLSSLLLLLTFLFSYHFFFQTSHSEEGQATQVTDQATTIPNP